MKWNESSECVCVSVFVRACEWKNGMEVFCWACVCVCRLERLPSVFVCAFQTVRKQMMSVSVHENKVIIIIHWINNALFTRARARAPASNPAFQFAVLLLLFLFRFSFCSAIFLLSRRRCSDCCRLFAQCDVNYCRWSHCAGDTSTTGKNMRKKIIEREMKTRCESSNCSFSCVPQTGVLKTFYKLFSLLSF